MTTVTHAHRAANGLEILLTSPWEYAEQVVRSIPDLDEIQRGLAVYDNANAFREQYPLYLLRTEIQRERTYLSFRLVLPGRLDDVVLTVEVYRGETYIGNGGINLDSKQAVLYAKALEAIVDYTKNRIIF